MSKIDSMSYSLMPSNSDQPVTSDFRPYPIWSLTQENNQICMNIVPQEISPPKICINKQPEFGVKINLNNQPRTIIPCTYDDKNNTIKCDYTIPEHMGIL